MTGRVFLGCTSTQQELLSCSRTQGSDAHEARTRNPSVSSQAVYPLLLHDVKSLFALYLDG